MQYPALFQAIEALTKQASLLAKQEKLALCFEKITERQALLENLQRVLEQKGLLSEAEIKNNYVELIHFIQLEDNQAVNALSVQRDELMGRVKKQSTIKKAMNAYHNVLLAK